MKAWMIAGGMACAIMAGMAAISAVPVWLLWNWVMPDLLHVGEISLVQAWTLSALCSMLFKSEPSLPGKEEKA